MQGFVLPLVVAALLAAPVVWRLGGDMRESPAAAVDNDDRSKALPLSRTAHSFDDRGSAKAVYWQSQATVTVPGLRPAKGSAAAGEPRKP